MEAFHRFAFFTIARDSAFVALAAATSMLAFSFEPALSLAIGASIALTFAIALLVRFGRLDDQRIVRTEAWRILKAEERPTGSTAKSSARADLEDLLLRFAKSATKIAIVLFSAALAFSLARPAGQVHALVSLSLH